jgi:hypothetical protein
MTCTHAQGNVSGGVVAWFKDITGQTVSITHTYFGLFNPSFFYQSLSVAVTV